MDNNSNNNNNKPKSSRFRNSGGQRYVSALFQETAESKETVLYSLKSHDGEYPSLRRLYLQECDPTEYRFAEKFFEDWSHWQLVLAAPWFQEYIAEWRKELRVKLRSMAMARMMRMAGDPDHPNAYSANKYLLDTLGRRSDDILGDEAQPTRRGRPRNRPAASPAFVRLEQEKRIDTDFSRLLSLSGNRVLPSA